jgi:hypothetical protein
MVVKYTSQRYQWRVIKYQITNGVIANTFVYKEPIEANVRDERKRVNHMSIVNG